MVEIIIVEINVSIFKPCQPTCKLTSISSYEQKITSE